MSASRRGGQIEVLLIQPHMLLSALKVKLAAMVAVAGIDTAEMPGTSAELTKILESLAADQAAAQKAVQDKTTGPDVNKSFNGALVKVNELAAKGDEDAQYALAHWGVLNNSNVNDVIASTAKLLTKVRCLPGQARPGPPASCSTGRRARQGSRQTHPS